MRLTDDELRDVLERAEEIQLATRHGPQWNAEVAAVLSAAEEVGLSRRAVERALRERLNLPALPPAVGSLAWAKSADGKSYVAEVLALSDDGARVRFLGGSEHLVPLDELRSCAFIPGERVVVDWPWWGTWTCTVIAYDAANQCVKLNDGWGYTKTFPISEVWLAPHKPPHPTSARRKVYATLVGAGLAAGTVIGAIVTALLLS
jgi:hypothetical protein